MPDINVQLPDGSNVAFPDGTPNDVMEGAIRAHLKMPTAQTTQAANTAQAPAAKGDVRPSTSSVYQQMKSQIVDPALGVGQQTLSAIKDIPSIFAPHYSQDELQKGKALVSSLPFVDNRDPGVAGAMLGATARRAGQAANDALAVVSSPFNLATAGIQKHISSVLEPWQNVAKSMYGQQAHVDAETGRYTTGNEDVDKTIDNVVGAIPFALAEGAIHPPESQFQTDIGQMRRGIPKTDSSAPASVKSTHMGPISDPVDNWIKGKVAESTATNTSSQKTQVDFASKAPIEAQAPTETSGASKVGNAPVVDRQALIAPRPPGVSLEESTGQLDRRQDSAGRLRVSQMTPDELKQELLTSKVTGLPNRRAFDEAPDSQAIGMSDADGLKALNDKYGYAAGNALLKAKADALTEAGLDAYHDKGDEFLFRGDTQQDLQAKLAQARGVLRNKTIEAPLADGSIKKFQGADFSFGVGPDEGSAEQGLKFHKAQREVAGERARGELRGITEVGGTAPTQQDFPGLAKQAGLVYKGELHKDSGVHMFEDPSRGGQTMALDASDVPAKGAADYIKQRMQDKLKQFEAKPAPLEASRQAQSFDLPAQMHKNFDTIAKLKNQADLAETDEQSQAMTKRADELGKQSADMLKQHIKSLSWDQLQQLKDDSTKRSGALDAQAKAIRDLTEATVKNRGVKSELTDMRSQGGPVRRLPDPEGGEAITVKPEDKVGRGGRSILDALQGRKPTSDFENIQVAGKPEGVSDQEWAEHVGKLQDERQDLKRKISDAVTIAADTGSSVHDMGIDDHVDRLKQIEGLLGKYAEPSDTGRRASIAPEVDEQGAIKAPEALKSWTLERARLALGSKVKQMPTDEEFFQHADMRAEKSRLYKTVSDVAQKILDVKNRQRGSIGEGPGVRGVVKPVSFEEDAESVPGDKDIVRRAKKLGFKVGPVSEDTPMSVATLFSRDGKTQIDSTTLQHDDIAQALLPELADGAKVSTSGRALRAMLAKGWGRKAGAGDYEIWNLDNKAKDIIEKDQLYNGRYGQDIRVETRVPGKEGLQAYSLPDEWDQKYSTVAAALDAEKNRQARTQQGAISGTQLLTSSSIGGVIGSVVGAHLGHPLEGGAIGWGLGFVTPAVVDSPYFKTALAFTKHLTSNSGIALKDWLLGPKQEESVLPDMAKIRDAQRRGLQSNKLSFVQRMAQLPGDFNVNLRDKFALLSDRPGAISNFMMKFDPRGQAFRDLRGQLDVEHSPYVSARMAGGIITGMSDMHLEDYRDMTTKAQKAGVLEHLENYLNLKGYERAYNVAAENIQEHDQNIAQLKQQLAQPNLHFEQKARLTQALRDTMSDRKDITDRITQKTMVPAPYDYQKIQQDLADMPNKLGAQKFQDVKDLADRGVFRLNRKVLDMIHDNGLIGDEAYQKFTARGDEYIPMHRILGDFADKNGQLTGTAAGSLHLKQQNVVKALIGSDKINVDPIVASANANLEAIKEVVRNGVIKDFLKLGASDPQGVGSYFKYIQPGYKLGPDEGLVGAYHQGQSHTFAVPSWLAESLNTVSPASADVIGKGPLKYMSDLMRKGATTQNLAWSLPNAVRHLSDMAIMSDAGLVAKFMEKPSNLPKDVTGFIKEWNKSVYSALTHDQVFREYSEGGASGSVLQRVITPEKNMTMEELGFLRKVPGKVILDSSEKFNKIAEDATRLTTFKDLRLNGASVKQATWETMRYGGGPDFAQQGRWTPAINLASMFFNARLAYVSRAFARIGERPGRSAIALAAMTTMGMTLAQWNYQQKDQKGNDLMRKVPFSERENYHVILHGDVDPNTGLPRRTLVPKGAFEKLIYNPIENMINKWAGREERSGTQIGLQAVANIVPGNMDLQEGDVKNSMLRGAFSATNPLVKTPIEEAMNYNSTGSGGPITPRGEQGIESKYQFGPGTSQMAKQVGQGGMKGAEAGAAEGATMGYLIGGMKGAAVGGALGGVTGAVGVSPRRVDHVVDTTTAGLGRMATGFVDPFLGGVKQTRMKDAGSLSQTPLIGPVVGRFMGAQVDQEEQTKSQNFYRDAQAAQTPLNTLNFLKKQHPEMVGSFMQEHKNDLFKGQLATTMLSRMSEIQGQEKALQQAPVRTPDDTDATYQDKIAHRQEALTNVHDAKLRILDSFNHFLAPKLSPASTQAHPGQGQGNAAR